MVLLTRRLNGESRIIRADDWSVALRSRKLLPLRELSESMNRPVLSGYVTIARVIKTVRFHPLRREPLWPLSVPKSAATTPCYF